MNRKETGRSRTWARTLLSMLLSGTMLAGPGTMRVDAAKEGDVRESWQEQGVDTVLSPDVTSTYDSRTGVTTQSQKKTSTRKGVTYTQKYQLVDYKDTLKDSTVDVYTASKTGIPKKGDAYDGGTVTDVSTSHDDKSHKTIVTVTYTKSQDVYTGAATPKKNDVSYSVDVAKVPKSGDPYQGGKVTGVQHDDAKHQTNLTVQYDTTSDTYTASTEGIPKKGDATYGSNTAGIPKKGDTFNGGKVTDVAVGYNQDVHRTDVLITYETTQDVLTPSTTGIPKPGDMYNGGTVYTVTTSQDGYKTNATILTTKTEDVYTVSTTGIPKKGDTYNGGTVTDVTTTHDDAKHETVATVNYDTTSDVYTASTTGIPKKGDSYKGGTVTSVTTTHDDAKHETVATIKYDTVTSSVKTESKTVNMEKYDLNPTSDSRTRFYGYRVTIGGKTYTAEKYDLNPTSDSRTRFYGYRVTIGGKTYIAEKYDLNPTSDSRTRIYGYRVTIDISTTTTTTTSNTATVSVNDIKTTLNAYTASTAIPQDGDAFELTVTDVKKTYNPTVKKTEVDVTYTAKLPKFGISWSATSGTGYLEDIVAGGRLRIHQAGDTCSGKLSNCWSKHDDVAHQTNVGGMIIGAVGGTPFIYGALVGKVAVPDTYSALKTATVTVADVRTTKTTSSSETLTVEPSKSTKTVTNTAWFLLDDLKTTVSDVTTTHDDIKHETMATVTYEATQPPVYTAGDLTAIPKEGDAYGGGTVWKVLTTHDDVKHQTNATVWWKKTIDYAVDTNLIPQKGDPYDVVVADVKEKYDAATKKTQVDVTYSVQLNGAAYSYSNSFMKSFIKEDEIAAGYKLPAVGNKYSGTTANGFNTHNDVTHQTYINPVFSVLLPGTRAITSRVYAYVADYNTEGGVKTYAVADLKSAKTATETKTFAVADVKSTKTATETKTLAVVDTKSTVRDVAATHDDAKHETKATVTYETVLDTYTQPSLPKAGDAFKVTVTDFPGGNVITYAIEFPAFGISGIFRSGGRTAGDGIKIGDIYSGTIFSCGSQHDDAKHGTYFNGSCKVKFGDKILTAMGIPGQLIFVPDVNITSETKTFSVPDTKISSTVSHTNVFEVQDAKKTENVTTTVKEPVYGWVTTSTKSHQVVTTSYVPVGTIVQPSLLPSAVTATRLSVFLGNAQTRRVMRADQAIASTAQANTGSAVAYNVTMSKSWKEKQLEEAQAVYDEVKKSGTSQAQAEARNNLNVARKALGLPEIESHEDDDNDDDDKNDDNDKKQGGSNGNSNSGSWSGSNGSGKDKDWGGRLSR